MKNYLIDRIISNIKMEIIMLNNRIEYREKLIEKMQFEDRYLKKLLDSDMESLKFYLYLNNSLKEE